jgi:hypothetical protein
LQEVARYVQEKRAVRLIYFHPPGAMLYPNAVASFIDRMGVCRKAAQCGWLTLTQAAEFMDKREQTRWHMDRADKGWQLVAKHAQDLKDLAWRIPVQRFEQPSVALGDAEIEQQGDEWIVVARSGKILQLNIKEVQ